MIMASVTHWPSGNWPRALWSMRGLLLDGLCVVRLRREWMHFEESRHDRRDPLVSVLDHPVPRVGQAMDFGAWKESQKALEKVGRKTPIAHAPHKQPRITLQA